MKNLNLLSKAEMKNVIGGVAEEDGKCAIYSISTSSSGETTRTLLYWVNAHDNPSQYASNTADITGNRTGYDCDGVRFTQIA